MMRAATSLGLGVLVLVGAACGPGAAAEAVRPEAPTAAGALEEAKCHGVTARAEPLVVDWKPEQRGKLELAMAEGVAVVAYSCEGIRLLDECRVEGSYGFLGMTRREQVVRLESADEVRANLPLSGVTLGGELGRDASLDIAMVMVGKRRTTWDALARTELSGECTGATHFVRGALVGAFVMETGSRAKVRAAAEILGAGAETSSSSSRETRVQDGDPGDCKKASPGAAAPPDQCGAPIRLMLAAITETAPEPVATVTDEAPPAPAAEAPVCPTGLVFTGDKCATPAAEVAFQCAGTDAAECEDQCQKGHAGSCGTLAGLVARGSGVPADPARAAGLFQQACEGGVPAACVELGAMTAAGAGVTKDAAAAVGLYERACHEGEAGGCAAWAGALSRGEGVTADAARALALYQQACHGGHVASCAESGARLLTGTPSAAQVGDGAALLKRACDGGHAASCATLGELHETGGPGGAVRKDPILAAMLLRRACMFGSGAGCLGLGRLQLGGSPGAGSEQEAKGTFERACMLRDPLGCGVLKVVFGDARPFVPDVARMQALRTACSGGQARACALSGIIALGQGVKPLGLADLQRACAQGDGFACAVQKRVK